jgi:hypothetical protein
MKIMIKEGKNTLKLFNTNKVECESYFSNDGPTIKLTINDITREYICNLKEPNNKESAFMNLIKKSFQENYIMIIEIIDNKIIKGASLLIDKYYFE